ncbi:hypothetical protein [Polyangium mundeleinium]|uniref:Uncharacterized protein n=1 Tax=Polyangium mundeleinium TaxID=2995306 RepID=A0ABT5EJU4_9BACT|nr:hypothetical protein [Polyangium mundeleinium]MDC0742100.1 hypothetical protein [Polyangium mundeleinium]
MTTKEEESDELSKEFVVANVRLLVESLERTRTFAEAVNDHRRLEAEFVARAPDNEFHVLETRRGIAETILSLAYEKHPPFEACRAAWNEAVRLGFKDLAARCDASRFYADCCRYDEKTEEGLAVLEPLLAELERGFEEAKAAQTFTGLYEQELANLGDLQGALLAQQRGEPNPERSTRRLDEAHPPTPEEERNDALWDEFSEACLAVYKTFARTRERSFADVAADYKRVEAEFTARAGEDEATQDLVLSVKERIADDLLRAATMLEQPFEVCREAWNEVVRLGFPELWEQCWMARRYVEACLRNHKPEEGLAVLEPLVAELERGLDAELKRRSEAQAKGEVPMQAGLTPTYYQSMLRSLRELRDKLEAQRSGP